MTSNTRIRGGDPARDWQSDTNRKVIPAYAGVILAVFSLSVE